MSFLFSDIKFAHSQIRTFSILLCSLIRSTIFFSWILKQFLNIPSYQQMPESWKSLWDIKAGYLIRNKEDETTETVYPRAGIYAEFGKIICISCGFIQGSGDQKKMMLKSFAGDNEKILLHEFAEMLKKWSAHEQRYLCGHNGKEFDFPYLCRRMIINNIPIPAILNIAGKKPWEVNHLDTMELWKFGDFKNYTSLNLLAHALGHSYTQR